MKILIAPLDWGLGHTTRCIPLIRFLQQSGHQVIAAAEGASAKLLAENFPGIALLPLRGYRISYSRSRWLFSVRILAQIPRILAAVKRERAWLREQQLLHRFDLVISDNRYGLYHSQLHAVILTHQLQIHTGKGKIADMLLRKLHYRMLRRFDACWIVDEKEDMGLSGTLAHPAQLPGHASYIGALSQFAGSKTIMQEQKDHILVLLSGPEPMRGQLEQLVLRQAAGLTQYAFTVVAGNPLGRRPHDLPEHLVYHTHLPAAALAAVLERAALVVCRSGYSSVMDLAVLGKKALLVPTPGQSEQEYLARYLHSRGYFSTRTQERLQLGRDIPKALAAGLLPLKPSGFSERAVQVITELLVQIRKVS